MFKADGNCNDYERTLTFLIIYTISQIIPNQRINIKPSDIPNNLEFAILKFYAPVPVDILLGAGTRLVIIYRTNT